MKLYFEVPKGNDCYGCRALNKHYFYCEYFKEYLKDENGNAGCLKCEECKSYKLTM